MQNHEFFIKECLKLARQALDSGNAPVGSLIVLDDKIIGEGIEAGKSKGDITCHSEIEAIRDAVKNYGKDLSRSILYTTHEPCIMCSYVIRHHKVSHLVMGVRVPVIGGVSSEYPILKANDINIWASPPSITENICSEECEMLTEEFKRLLKKP